MWCHNIDHHPNMLRRRWILSPRLPIGALCPDVVCIWLQSHLQPGWIGWGRIYVSIGLGYVSLQNIHVVLTSFSGNHLQASQPGVAHKCSCEFQSIRNPCILFPTGYTLEWHAAEIWWLEFSCTQISPLARAGTSFWYQDTYILHFCDQHTVPQYFWCGDVCCSCCQFSIVTLPF